METSTAPQPPRAHAARGCGKTTGLRMIAGLKHAESGEIRIAGRPVNELEPTDRDVALVFQSYARSTRT